MTVVVTGASGFIGGALVSLLRQANIPVLAVARRDIPNSFRVADYSQAPLGDVLVHLAQYSDRAAMNAAGIAAELVAESETAALLAKGYARVLYASSGAVYGDQHRSARRPGDPTLANDSYTRLKLRCEEQVLATGEGVVLRLANIYGPGMSPANVVSAVLRQLPHDGPLEIFDERPMRDFLWYGDAATGIAAFVDSTAVGVFNLGTGAGTSVGSLARAALALSGQPNRAVTAMRPAGKASTLILDISATVQQCSWRPRTSLQEGLSILINQARPQLP